MITRIFKNNKQELRVKTTKKKKKERTFGDYQ